LSSNIKNERRITALEITIIDSKKLRRRVYTNLARWPARTKAINAKRRTIRRPMTCCIGMMCNDGVILAADTQESWGTGEKTYVGKMFPLTGEHRKAIVAGAGASRLIDYAVDRIFGVIPQTLTLEDAETNLRKLMGDLYSDEFEKYPCEKENKEIQLLVVLQFRKEYPCLFSVDSTMVRRVHMVRMIGVETLTSMAQDFHSMKLTVPQAAWACIYLLKIAKDRYGGVGGTTHLMSITESGEFDFERTWDISQREQALGRLDYLTRRLLIGMVPATSEPMSSATIRSAVDVLRVTRAELKHIDSEFQRAQRIDRGLTKRAKHRIEKAALKIKPE
jgi:hypothetical protein